jgi:hypothetical protein
MLFIVPSNYSIGTVFSTITIDIFIFMQIKLVFIHFYKLFCTSGHFEKGATSSGEMAHFLGKLNLRDSHYFSEQ